MLSLKSDTYKYDELVKEYASFKTQTEDELNKQRNRAKETLLSLDKSIEGNTTELKSSVQN